MVARPSGIATQSVVGMLAQLTQGIVGLGLLLVGHQHQLSVATSALAVSAYGIGMAIGRPLQGRTLDLVAPRGVLACCALLHGGAYLLVVLTAAHRFGVGFTAASFLAGLALPPIATQMRSDWPRRAGPDEQVQIFALIATLQTVSLLLAPLLFTVIAAQATPTVATLTIAGVSVVCSVLFGLTAHARAAAASGRVQVRRYMLPLAVSGGLGAVSGVVEVSAPAVALAGSHPHVAGVLAACATLGTLIGGVVAMRVHWPVRAQLSGGLAVQALGAAVLLVPASLVLAGAALFVMGLGFAPALAALGVLVSQRARGTAESFGWQSTALGLGVAAGSAAAGGLVGVGAHLTALPALASVLACLLVSVRVAREQRLVLSAAGRR